MDNNLRYFKAKLVKITYIDFQDKKLYGFIFANKYVKQDDRLDVVRKYLDKNVKKIVSYEKVDGFIPVDLSYINRIDIDYHL